MIKTILFGYNMVLIWQSKEGDKVLKKIKFILFSVLILLLCTSCAQTEHEPTHPNKVSFGNITHGGYFVECENGYIYFDDEKGTFYKKDLLTDTVEPIAKSLMCSSLNLYNDCLYYTRGDPGPIWKMSVDGKQKKPLTFFRQGKQLVVYNDHMYFCRYSAYTDEPLVRTDLNGGNEQVLVQEVGGYCIINDRIYYTDIAIKTEPKLCSMKTDGTDVKLIRYAYATGLMPMGNKLLYSDYYRENKMFIYDLDTDTETCICEDRCVSLNANEKWIFYRNQNDNGNLYKIRPDGSDRQKILDVEVSYIHVIGNRLFYKDSYWNRPLDGPWVFKYIDIE